MYPIINAAPRAELLGVQDVSFRPPVYEPEMIPTHLPHVYIYAEKGPTLPQLVSGDAMISTYGRKTFDARSKYYNHQTLFATLFNGNANRIMVQRIVPEDAGPKSRLLLSLDIVEDDIPTYERNTDGSFKLDQAGAKIPTGTTVRGYKGRWVLNDWTVGSNTNAEFGQVPIQAGSLTATNGTQSQLYPILELEANFQGEYGNNLGLVLEAPTSRSNNPTNPTVYERLKAFTYRMRLVSRADQFSTANTLFTLKGDTSFEFTLKPKAINTQTEAAFSLDDVLIKTYQELNQRGFPPQYGPFGRMKLYRSHLEELLLKVGETESDHAGILPEEVRNADAQALYSVNLFTAQNWDGVPYHSLVLDGPIDGGLRFSDSSVHYAAGGSDGTMSFEAFDKAVRNEVENYGDLEAPLMDDALYPQSCIYDSGFTLETKKSLLTVIGRRKDMAVILSTQDVSQPINKASEDSSIAVALRAAARNYPESEVYGTSVCRAMVVGHAGTLLDHPYHGLVPFTYEVGDKFSKYMGSSNGIWKSGKAFDMPPNNHVTLFSDANITWKRPAARSRDWTNGLVWAQNYDRLSRFFPAFQTVYDDDTSTLNSARTMWLVVELEKVAQRTWRDLTGITKLTVPQFIERSNQLIRDRTKGRFDESAIVVPETFQTWADEQRGYSWSCKIHLYSNNMMTVGVFTIVAHRMSEYQGG